MVSFLSRSFSSGLAFGATSAAQNSRIGLISMISKSIGCLTLVKSQSMGFAIGNLLIGAVLSPSANPRLQLC